MAVPSLVDAIAFAQGGSGDHTCALFAAGAVECWGRGSYGELGDGTTTDSTTPVAVFAGTFTVGAAAIAVGQFHTCVLLPGRSFACWGRNDFGQLGNGTTTDALTPIAASL